MKPTSHVLYVGADVPADLSDALGERTTIDVVGTAADCFAGLSSTDCVVVTDEARDATPVELCSRIRDRQSDVPIVVFPAAGSERLAGDVIAAGVDGYVPRSQGVETLSRRVSEHLSDAGETGGPVRGRSSKRLELLVEQSPLAIIEWNLAFEVRSWNPAATELFGYAPREAVGRSAFDLIVPETERADVESHWNGLVDALAAGADDPARKRNCNVRKDGTPIACEWFNTPLIDDGEVVGVLSFGQDVTGELERADALETLQETTHELMRTTSADAIAEIVIDAAERVIERPLAGLRLYDADADRLEIAATTGFLEHNSDAFPAVGPDGGVLWTAYDRGEPIVVDDASAALVPYEIDQPVGNALFHPLGDHGVLSVGSIAGRELDVADVNLVNALAAAAEAALDRAVHERELERAKTIIDAVGDGVYAVDDDGTFVAVNDMLTTVTGYDRAELVGERVSMVLTDRSFERARSEVRALESADGDATATYEVALVTKSGDRVPSEVTSRLLTGGDSLEGTVGIVRDIRDRKRMERELADRRAKIERLHDVASRLDDCEDPQEIYELTVAAAEDVLNFDVGVIDRAVGDYLEKAALSTHIAEADYIERFHVSEGIAGKTYRTQRTYRIDETEALDEGMNETDTYRSLLSVPVGEHGVFQAASTDRNAFDRDDEELTELLLSHVTDRLNQLASEAELKDERDRFVALFENVPDAVVSLRYRDGDPIVEATNSAFEHLFGYDEAELVGRRLDRYVVPPDGAVEARALNRRAGAGEIVETEVKRRTADGLRDFMVRLVPIEVDADSTRAFGLYTDITDQKQRQKRVEILNRVLRHDLRNGMNVVTGCAEMLEEAVDDDHAGYVSAIEDRAADLIELAAKTRAVERTLERPAGAGPVDVAAAVDRSLARLEAEYPCAELECTVPDGVFARAGDDLETALAQLLENAVEHHDGSAPTVAVAVRERRDDDLIVLSVADDGPGVPAEERALLEEDREITQLRHASGLGLWLVDWIVTQSGGRLAFSDNEPRGTVVRLELPRADPDAVASGGD
jgi:PAS domain S-box-containing protein